jgi:hypothetical protein
VPAALRGQLVRFAPTIVELAVLVAANLAATLLRFVLLRIGMAR